MSRLSSHRFELDVVSLEPVLATKRLRAMDLAARISVELPNGSHNLKAAAADAVQILPGPVPEETPPALGLLLGIEK